MASPSELDDFLQGPLVIWVGFIKLFKIEFKVIDITIKSCVSIMGIWQILAPHLLV